MKNLTKWVSAVAVTVLLASPALCAEAVAAGKVKGIDAEKKQFVLTDSAGKDWTFKLGDNLVVNRDGKEGKSNLKAGDEINVCYDKGVLTWTADYILVQEGDHKNCHLMEGTIKSYDTDKKQLTFTDAEGKDMVFPMGDARVRVNKEDSKIAEVKIGDHALAIVDKTGDKATLKCLMINRK